MPSWETRRSSLSTEPNGNAGSACSFGLSAAKASVTTRRVVACTPHVGDGFEPVGELGVQIVEIAEGAAEEEVLADVAERPLDLALGLGPVGPAGFRVKAVMAGEVEQRAVVDDAALRRFADHGGLHAVVEDLPRHAADGREGGDVAAQHRLQVLMQDEAGPEPAARAEHQREQPDDPRHRRLVGEHDLELGEVDLRLAPGGVSKRTSNGGVAGGRTLRRKSVTAV